MPGFYRDVERLPGRPPLPSHFLFQGTVFTAGSLQGPGPAGPKARTRDQIRCPLVWPVVVVRDRVTEG